MRSNSGTTQTDAGRFVRLLLSADPEAWSGQALEGFVPFPGATRLLPYAWLRMRALGLRDHPWHARASAAYRDTWRRNEVLLARALPALRALDAAGIEAMLLKGAVLLDEVYRDRGARPMLDLDLLVAPETVAAAALVLEREGWRRESAVPVRLVTRHDFNFRHPAGNALDVHQRLFPSASPALTGRFLAGGAPASRLPAGRPATTDLLFHTIVHGAVVDLGRDPRWLLDAALICRDEPIDWNRIVEYAASESLGEGVESALATMRDCGVDVPALSLGPAKAKPPGRLVDLAEMWHRGGVAGIRAFLRQLSEDWEVEGMARLPLEALRRPFRKSGLHLSERELDRIFFPSAPKIPPPATNRQPPATGT